MTDNPYRKLWQELLLFDKAVKAELNAAYAERKSFLLADTLVFAAGMIVAGIGTFLCIYMSGLIQAYRLLIMNETYQEKRK